MQFVTAYSVTRNYGGPEEGGWWYNWLEPIETVPCEPDVAETIKTYLQLKHESVAFGDIYSVLGGTALNVLIEDEAGENATKERPHYE